MRGQLGIILLLHFLRSSRAAGADRVDYRYEDYSEDSGRVHVRTHGASFEKALGSWLTLKGSYVYDTISGATPTGAPPIPGETRAREVTISDIRRGGTIEPVIRKGRHTFSPQLSISEERDYESRGIALTHSMELNDRNTTLTWGLSHTFDTLLPRPGTSNTSDERKDTTDFIAGVSQILGPRTVIGLTLTLGYSTGFLNDPYKRVLFDDFYTAFNPYNPGDPWTVQPEKRPGHRFRQVLHGSLQHHVPRLRGALDVSCRFQHDDFGIIAGTVESKWHQKLGQRVVLSPMFRFHTQTAADFYGTHFPGDPSCMLPPPFCTDVPAPKHYSADHRLSAMNTFTGGVDLSVKLHERLSIEIGYKRYVTRGTDGLTAASVYPKANIFKGGLTLWF